MGLPQLRLARRADVGPPAGQEVLGEGTQGIALPGVLADPAGPAEDHHGALLHRVFEGRAGEHETVDVRDGHTDLGTRA